MFKHSEIHIIIPNEQLWCSAVATAPINMLIIWFSSPKMNRFSTVSLKSHANYSVYSASLFRIKTQHFRCLCKCVSIIIRSSSFINHVKAKIYAQKTAVSILWLRLYSCILIDFSLNDVFVYVASIKMLIRSADWVDWEYCWRTWLRNLHISANMKMIIKVNIHSVLCVV